MSSNLCVVAMKFDSDKMIESLQEMLALIDEVMNTAANILRQDPSSMGELWSMVQAANNVCKNVGLGLVVIFFLVSFVFKLTEMDWRNISIDFIIRELIKLILAKALIDISMDICLLIFNWGSDFMQQLTFNISGNFKFSDLKLDVIKKNFEDMKFYAQLVFIMEMSIPKVIIYICEIVTYVICYGRVLQISLMTIISPIPLSTVAGETRKHTALHFTKKYVGVVCQGAIIILMIAIFKGVVMWLMAGVGQISSITSLWKLAGVAIVLVVGILGSNKTAEMFLGD